MTGDFVKSFKISKIAKNFIIADLVLFGGWGLVSPIMAVFIIDEVPGANLVTVGLMTTIYWAVRSSIELPMATVIEKTKSEKDDLYVLILGLLLVSIAAFWLTVVKTVPQLFVNQAIKALGFAFYAASWSGIFSRHIDTDKAARTWAIDHTVLGIATGITGAVGGYLAVRFGFNAIFIAAGITSFVAAVIVFLVPDIVFPGKKYKPVFKGVRNHSPKTER